MVASASLLKESHRLEGKRTMGLEFAEQLDWRISFGIAWVELASNNRPRPGRCVAGADADVRVVDGAPGLRRCAIATAGEIIIG